MDLLITDLTEMGQGTYCVAGWDTAAKRMVRPLPNGSNWPEALIAQYGIVPGTSIEVAPRGLPNGIFPHRTEDTPIDATSIKVAQGLFSNWTGAAAPQIATDLSTGFDGQLKWNKEWNGVRQGVHVLPQVRCSSLVAVCVPKANLAFAESFGKLKATLNDGTNTYHC